MNRKILALLWLAMFLSGCTKYTDEQFFAAIKNGDTKVVQSILDQRDMTKVRDKRGFTINEDTKNAELTFDQSKMVEEKNERGFSGLWVAVENGRPEMVDLLLQQKFSLTEEHFGISVMEIETAAQPCNPKIIRSLAKNGADIDAVGRLSKNSLILTPAFLGNWECVNELISLGANTKVVDINGKGLVSNAASSVEEIDVDSLIDRMKGFDPLSYDASYALVSASVRGNSKIVKNFLNRGFNGCFIHKGKYPRDYAIKKQHTETAELLPTKEQCEKNLN